MKDTAQTTIGYFEADQCDLAEFQTIIDQTTTPDMVPHAADIQSNVPLYDAGKLRGTLNDPAVRKTLMAEWAQVLLKGAGALAIKGAYSDTDAIDQATEIYNKIIASEKQINGAKEDHFAASGANDRIWNSLQKLCEADPEVFFHYFANAPVAAVCEAWLGPNYQMTAQVNLVHPGGAAQQAHRDYHLGFQTADINAQYPAHVHDLSPVLTLQGAIAHCDMPLESGPTKLLPFSQSYRAGYAAWRRDDFRALFEERYIQLPLSKGDALFFNPAIFHGAGANTSSDIARMANLIQVSSAFGRAMETIDRRKMCKLVYPLAQASGLDPLDLNASIAATAEGYAFPTSLDTDPPTAGLAPETQAALFHRAMDEKMAPETFNALLDQMAARQRA